MLIAVIPVKDDHSTIQQINLAHHQADGVELRLDYSKKLDIRVITALRQACRLPVIFTLRKKSQGGFYPYDEDQRLKDILTLCKINPDYIDLEYDIYKDFLQEIKSRYPDIKLIGSYHNFDETPENLTAIFQSLQHPCFDAYKIATIANKTLDALRMLQFVHAYHQQYCLTGICMGEEGQSTRILSPIMGSAMNYASLDISQATAPGQLTLDELSTIYHLRKLNSASKIYALLGDPITNSVGHILHNQAIEFLGENAVYLKLRATQDELPAIIQKCRELKFSGLSVTMPLKESSLPLLDEIEPASQAIKAINTVVNRQGKWIGLNTDGIGAMQALSENVSIANQKIVILGAGGAARAIAYEALQHKAEVMILNRTISKAKKLAHELGCESGDLSYLVSLKNMKYTILINTLPNKVYSEQPIKALLNTLPPNLFAMDIIYQPINTSFLKMAQKAHCVCIFGYQMYIAQALMQIKHWFQPEVGQLEEIRNRMERYFSP